MKNYKVEIVSTLTHNVMVRANSKEQAGEKAVEIVSSQDRGGIINWFKKKFGRKPAKKPAVIAVRNGQYKPLKPKPENKLYCVDRSLVDYARRADLDDIVDDWADDVRGDSSTHDPGLSSCGGSSCGGGSD